MYIKSMKNIEVKNIVMMYVVMVIRNLIKKIIKKYNLIKDSIIFNVFLILVVFYFVWRLIDSGSFTIAIITTLVDSVLILALSAFIQLLYWLIIKNLNKRKSTTKEKN